MGKRITILLLIFAGLFWWASHSEKRAKDEQKTTGTETVKVIENKEEKITETKKPVEKVETPKKEEGKETKKVEDKEEVSTETDKPSFFSRSWNGIKSFFSFGRKDTPVDNSSETDTDTGIAGTKQTIDLNPDKNNKEEEELKSEAAVKAQKNFWSEMTEKKENQEKIKAVATNMLANIGDQLKVQSAVDLEKIKVEAQSSLDAVTKSLDPLNKELAKKEEEQTTLEKSGDKASISFLDNGIKKLKEVITITEDQINIQKLIVEKVNTQIMAKEEEEKKVQEMSDKKTEETEKSEEIKEDSVKTETEVKTEAQIKPKQVETKQEIILKKEPVSHKPVEKNPTNTAITVQKSEPITVVVKPVVKKPVLANTASNVRVYVYEHGIDFSSKTIPTGTVNFEVINNGRFTHEFNIKGVQNFGKIPPRSVANISTGLFPGTYEVFSDYRKDYERGVSDMITITR